MSVVILGATSPIALAAARRYAELGHDVYVAARDKDEAERIANDLQIRYGIVAAGGHFDALEFEEHEDFVDTVEQSIGPVDVVLVAFGQMEDQEALQEDFARARKIIDINFTGAASLCEAFARRFIARRRGSIVAIGSVAGDRGRASNYFYGSAKGALAIYLSGLRNRCAAHDVHVLTVKPGFVDTRMTFELDTAIPIASPEETAEAIVNAQQRGTDILYYPAFWRTIMGVITAIPEAIFKKMSL